MKSEDKIALIKSVTGESAERTIRHFAENGGLHLTAYYECAGRQIPCTIDKSWQVHGVTMNEKEFSFIASKSGQAAMKFYVTMKEFVESVKLWLANAANDLKLNVEALVATIPKTIVFVAGPTEYVAVK